MSLMKRDGKGKENKQTACCYWQCLYWETDLKDDFDPMRKLDPCGQSLENFFKVFNRETLYLFSLKSHFNKFAKIYNNF